ncbi:preprotein translocase subunit SecD [Caballeronia novacaledonica]|uniref:Preprotein translocase subunit SecD n=1 Tax=Caballeronia novacaledonica TaxID=1544861 RepID=A0A2U3IA96_9BURK|nr:hypothetical protein [Caballeronia novacaledonica]SPB17131.1 preprotein translocase subunit SecD [Caballeronia novacaledonica]
MQASDILPDHADHAEVNGVTVRKGTAGAFLVNARIWLDTNAGSEARATAQRDIADALPALHALGFFDVLEIRDPALKAWIDAQ